jgi:hypothetical protein
MPRFSVEFYRPEVLGDRAPAFATILQRIAGLEAVQRIRRGADPAAVLSLMHQNGEFLGEAARIRMDDLPSVIDIANGNRHDLDVLDHEGLGEEIHFLYDSEINVIAVQNRLHFRASALERLLSELGGDSLDFQIILTEDAFTRFERMDFVSKINFKLARPRDLQGQPLPALNRVFREIDEFDGVEAKLEITIGRRRNRSLSLAAIGRLVAAYRGRREPFKSFSITGMVREEDGPEATAHNETVDFIKERLCYTQEVERRGRGRRFDTEGCRVALRRAIREHREYLRRYR